MNEVLKVLFEAKSQSLLSKRGRQVLISGHANQGLGEALSVIVEIGAG